jgi:hypothetical protein
VDTTTVSFSDRLQESFAQLYRYVPALFGAMVILFAGYLLARLFERGAERLLRRIKFNNLLDAVVSWPQSSARDRTSIRRASRRAGVLVRDVHGDARRSECTRSAVAGECVLRARELHPESSLPRS